MPTARRWRTRAILCEVLESRYGDACGCGLRIEEALAVSKEDFIEDGAILRVMWQASRDGNKRMPLKHRKQGEYRDIPVPSWLWEMVKDAPQGPLTPGLNGKLFKSYQVTFGRFKNAASAAGASLRASRRILCVTPTLPRCSHAASRLPS